MDLPTHTHALVSLFELMGATVEVDATCDDNLVRRGGPGEAAFVVKAEGMPNLVHELGHVLWLGALEDDHGIDYRNIPYDMHGAAGRRILIEELASSVLSCRHLAVHRSGEGSETVDPVVTAWFVEQVDIQPVFYGHDGDLAGFRAALDGFVRENEAALETAVDELARRASRWFIGLGIDGEIAHPPGLSFGSLWRAYRAACDQVSPETARTTP